MHCRKRHTIGEFGPTDRKRDVCLPDRPVQRAIRTERPLVENCRIRHNSMGSNATKGNVESLFFSPIVIVVRPTMDITINAIVVAPYPVHCLNTRTNKGRRSCVRWNHRRQAVYTKKRWNHRLRQERIGSFIRSNEEFVHGPSS